MNKLISTLLLLLFSINISAQTKTNIIEIGMNVSQYQEDFGIGLHIISPYFINSAIAIKVGANYQWLEYFNGTETIWKSYQNLQLGLRARRTIIEESIFIYGEAGIIAILPNNDFSTKSFGFGGYGLFGFEFKPNTRFAYFIELGGVGTGATADKLSNKPIYSNGFLSNVGFRVGI